MTVKFPIAAVSAIALATGAASNAEEAAELTPETRTTTVVIDETPVTVEVAPDGSGSPIINSNIAEAIGFEGSMVKGLRMVGQTRIGADSNLAQVDFGDGVPAKRRVFWFERDWSTIADGRIGPLALPQDIVTYRLGPVQAGETEIVLPMDAHERRGITTILTIEEVEIPVYFTFDRRETMMTASTGALLAESNMGRMSGEAYPLQLEMEVVRPVRPMEFDQPVMLGQLPLRQVVVRTQDTGSVEAIPDKDRDPNEIIVTGGKRKKARHLMYVGLESLAGCSSLTFDKPAKTIRLSCKLADER